jgi:hypothetical protein
MSFQLIDFKNPKDYSTNIFRVVRLRCFKQMIYAKTGEVLQSAREEPVEVYLCSSLNKKNKTRVYDWMSKEEVEGFPQWKVYETSSLQKAQDLVANNRIYFLNLERDTLRSDLFSFGPAYALPAHGTIVLVKTVCDGVQNVEEYMQLQRDRTTVVTTNIPFEPNSRNIHWTRTPSRAAQIDTMEYPYLTFIAEFCHRFSQAIAAPPEYYSFRYINTNAVTFYKPTEMCLTLLAAKEGEPLESHPSDLEMNESTNSTSMQIEEMAASLLSAEDDPQAQRDPASLAAEIEQMRASLCHEQERSPLYQQAERIVDLLCREEMEESFDESNKENLDPNTGLEDQECYLVYDESWLSSALEQPCVSQACHSSFDCWEQMHSEGLLVSSGTL